MRAIVVEAHGGPEQLVARDVAAPQPGRQQVLIGNRLTSVNFADIKARRGGYRNYALPFIPGLDAVGIVEAVGPGVKGLRPGQRVAAYTAGGSYAEKVLADEVVCFPLPDELSDEQGAAVGILVTAYNLLTLAGRLQAGETVLVHAGAGGVGSVAIQLALILGAGRVIATVGSEPKRELPARLGAEVIDYRRTDFAAQVAALTDGAGVDLILDSVGGEVSERGLTCLADFGRLVTFGHVGPAGRVETKALHHSNRAVIGYSSGGYRDQRPEVLRQSGLAVLELAREHGIVIEVGARFALEDAPQAHALVESRRSVGKVLLDPRKERDTQ